MSERVCQKTLQVMNEKGLHARPASLFVQAAVSFLSDIKVENLDTKTEADGKSVISMLMLAAPRGTRLRVTASGEDCSQALQILEELVLRGFDDE